MTSSTTDVRLLRSLRWLIAIRLLVITSVTLPYLLAQLATPGALPTFDLLYLLAGLPASVPGTTVNRLCGSGLDAVSMAARAIKAGESCVGVLLIGTDCPALDAACLRRAANALSETDAVILPTADGGYALLGLRRFDASVFADIAWSTPTVAATTLARLDALGWSCTRLPLVHDIDEPADLVHLPPGW